MKTLIISGTYTNNLGGSKLVFYDCTLYGQTPSHPECCYITSFRKFMRGYDELQEYSRKYYCTYFGTDAFNIISLENLQHKE